MAEARRESEVWEIVKTERRRWGGLNNRNKGVGEIFYEFVGRSGE